MVHYVKKEHLNTFVIDCFSFCFFIVIMVLPFFVPALKKESLVEKPLVSSTSTPIFNKKAFETVVIEGKAYVVYDLIHDEILAAKNENQILPLASITKVMTAISATLHAKKDEKIIITKKSIEDGYDLGLQNQQVWPLSELLKYTLVFSSNDGAEAVADDSGSKDFFVAQMNADAKLLGLNFVFTDPAGRDLSGNIGGKGSALDVAKLFGVARKNIPELLDATTKKRQTLSTEKEKVRGIPNTNQDIENYPGAEGSKTGFTDLAGGNLGVVVDVTLGRPIAIVVLGSTREGRFRDMQVLYEALKKSLVVK